MKVVWVETNKNKSCPYIKFNTTSLTEREPVINWEQALCVIKTNESAWSVNVRQSRYNLLLVLGTVNSVTSLQIQYLQLLSCLG